jgi:hypothetical protein
MALFSGDERFSRSLLDAQRFHAHPFDCIPPGRGRDLFRHGVLPVRAYVPRGQQRTTPPPLLHPGQSRLVTGEVLGCGTEGLAVDVPAADYYEQTMQTQLHADGVQHGWHDVVKLREVIASREHPAFLLQTTVREIVQGAFVVHLKIPFVQGAQRWFLANRVAATPHPREAHHLALEGRFYDPTDLLSREEATFARRKYLSAVASVSYPSNTPADQIDRHYAAHRDSVLTRRDRVQLPLVVIEQRSAGSVTLRSLIADERLFAKRNWPFLRATLLVVVGAVEYLQRRHRWMHGDLALSNIVLRRKPFFAKYKLPSEIRDHVRVRTLPSGHWRELDAADLRHGESVYLPRFIDLSRSAIDPEVGDRLTPPAAAAERSALFRAHAIDYMDGYSRTADMRRLGLMLCIEVIERSLVAREGARDYVSLQDLEWRVVHVARALAGGSAAWVEHVIAHGDFNRRTVSGEGCTSTAHSKTFWAFLLNLAHFEEYMARIEALLRKLPDQLPFEQYAAERDALRARASSMLDLATAISSDLNPFLGWLVHLAPNIEHDDWRRPTVVLDWHVFAV